MREELYSKAIPAIILLITGNIEAFGGLYFEGKRTKTPLGDTV